MRMVSIDNVAPGMMTAQSVFPEEDTRGLPLVAGKVVLTESLIERLSREGVQGVPISDETSEGIEISESISEETRRKSLREVKGVLDSIKETDGVINEQDLVDLESVISEVLAEISGSRSLLVALSDLNQFGGSRLQYAVNRTVMGINIGRRYFAEHGWKDFKGERRSDGIPQRLQKLGVGLMLLDIGALWVPEDVWNKQGILSSDERQLMQEHANYGVEMLRAADVSPLITVTVGQHHERFNGSGYPRGVSGAELHDNGQIAGIADQYMKMTVSENSDSEAKLMSPHDAYRRIVSASGKLFNPNVVEAFRAAVAPYGPGTCVRLSDGTFGIIESNVRDHPTRPIIRLTHGADQQALATVRTVDLSEMQEGDLDIVAALGALPGDTTSVPTT